MSELLLEKKLILPQDARFSSGVIAPNGPLGIALELFFSFRLRI